MSLFLDQMILHLQGPCSIWDLIEDAREQVTDPMLRSYLRCSQEGFEQKTSEEKEVSDEKTSDEGQAEQPASSRKKTGISSLWEELRRPHKEREGLPWYLDGFRQLCESEQTFGGKDSSAFAVRLQRFCESLAEEENKIQERQMRLSGLHGLLYLPWLFLIPAARFSMGNLPSLARFYQGSICAYFLALMLVVTLALQWALICLLPLEEEMLSLPARFCKWALRFPSLEHFVFRLAKRREKESRELVRELLRQKSRRTLSDFLLERVLLGLLGMVMTASLCLYAELVQISYVREGVDQFQTELPLDLYPQESSLRETLKVFLKRAKPWKNTGWRGYLRAFCTKEGLSEEVRSFLEHEIQARLSAPKGNRIFSVILSLVLSLSGFLLGENLPIAWLSLQQVRQKRRRWQPVLMMELLLGQIADAGSFRLQTALEWLERIPGEFASDLTRCRDAMGSGEEEALLELTKTEYLPFRLIAECLLSSDIGGIQQSLSLLSGSILLAERREATELDKRRKSEDMVMTAASYLPAIFVLGGFFIAPFVWESVRQLQSFLQSMQGW